MQKADQKTKLLWFTRTSYETDDLIQSLIYQPISNQDFEYRQEIKKCKHLETLIQSWYALKFRRYHHWTTKISQLTLSC